MDIYEAYEILKKRFPNTNPPEGFEYKDLFIFNTSPIGIGLPYAVNKDTKMISVFNPLHADPGELNSAYLKTKVEFAR